MIGALFALADATGMAERALADPDTIVVHQGSSLELLVASLGRGARGVAYAGLALGLLALSSSRPVPVLRWIGFGVGLLGSLATVSFGALLLLSFAGQVEAEFARQDLAALGPLVARSIRTQGLAETALGTAVGTTLVTAVLLRPDPARGAAARALLLALLAWLLSVGAEAAARITEAAAMKAAWGTHFGGTPGEVVHMVTTALALTVAGMTAAALLSRRASRTGDRSP